MLKELGIPPIQEMSGGVLLDLCRVQCGFFRACSYTCGVGLADCKGG